MFWRLWRALSDSFWVATVILSPYVKSRKFPKIAIFAIFGIFGCWSFRLQKSIKIVKNVKIFQNKLFTSQRCFQIPIMAFYAHYIQFYVNLKISKKLLFSHFGSFERKLAFSANFQIYVKLNIMSIKCHYRYLETSLGCKELVFENFHIFDNFYAFLQPKGPTSKNPKNRKNSIFWKFSTFYTRWWYHCSHSKIVRKCSSKPPKHIFKLY